MDRHFSLTLILIILVSCEQEKKSSQKDELKSQQEIKTPNLHIVSFEKESELYGEYFYPSKDISLNLTSPNIFELASNKFYEDLGEIDPYAFGQYRVHGDTLVLVDSLTQQEFILIRKSEELLTTLQCEPIPSGQNFLCWTKLYPNGGVKFTGGWKNGMKEGGWRFFDEDGNETLVYYEKGKVTQESKIIVDAIIPQPTFPGGLEGFKKYLKANYKWKQGQLTVEGNVFVQFIVLEDGSISDVKILKGLSDACDKEAIRLIKEMPKWNPAKQDGIPVKEKMVLPIKFGLMNPYE